MVQLAVMGIGAAAEMIAWRIVFEGRASVWRAMTATLVAMGAAAVLVRRPVWADGLAPSAAAAWGLASGIALYAATRAFVSLAWSVPAFRRGTSAAYGLAGDLSVAAAALFAGVMVVGEELFWRGLVQARLSESSAIAGAVWTWLIFVLVNVASASLAIVAGAIVGGAVWAALAWATGGILASMVCHITWTTLMIVRPPRRPLEASA
jgi:membrane protease YdiL (CAAX protease family)